MPQERHGPQPSPQREEGEVKMLYLSLITLGPRRKLLEQMEKVFENICEALRSGEMIVEVGE